MSKINLSDVIEITYLSRENARFSSVDGFLTLDVGKTHYPRVYLHRDFPFEMEREYISVLDEEKKEIGLIRSLDEDFDGEAIALF